MNAEYRIRDILNHESGEPIRLSALDGLVDPFQILSTIVLGLRVGDEQVVPVRDRLFSCKRPLTVENAETYDIEGKAKTLGMAERRAKTIRYAAVFFRLFRRPPQTFGDCLKINGIGPKAAALYLDVACGVPSVCIDTHCVRVLNRIGFNGDAKSLQLDLMTLLPKEDWNAVNLKVIDVGKRFCRPSNPKCDECFLDCSCF
jgi:endonuclease-3